MWFLGYLASFLIAVALVREYAEKRTNWGICAVVAISWGLGFSYFLVLPFDIANAFCRACDADIHDCVCMPTVGIEALADLIPVVYFLTMLLGYLMNDLLRGYLDSGEFTRRGRIKDALWEAAIFYVPIAVIGLVLGVYMIVHHGLSFSSLKALGRGMFNVLGLFILIAFLGYGLVEVPRYLWNQGNIEGLLRYYKFRVAVQSDALQNARRRLEETLELVHSTDVQLRHDPSTAPQLREYMGAIIRRCPKTGTHTHQTASMRPANGGSSSPPDEASSTSRSIFSGCGGGSSSGDEKLLPKTRKGLVQLHLRLKRSIANEKRERSMYEVYVRQAVNFQSLFEMPPSLPASHGGMGGARGMGPAIHGTRAEVNRWHGTIKPMLFRVAAVCCMALSLVVVWCEGTILLDGEPFNLNLSPLSYLYRWMGASGGGLFVLVCLFIPLLYCSACTYFSMFRMRLCEGMTLYPHQHSDGSSLLFNATYACRLGPPICFNYLKLLHEGTRGLYAHKGSHAHRVSTYFSQTAFGEMDQIPLFQDDYFNNYAPLLIVILCGCTYLNFGSGLLSCCSKCFPCLVAPAFSFDEDFSDARIDHGAQILVHEKQNLSEGAPLGTNLQLLSGATSDEEGGKVRSVTGRAAPARRFNRLQDESL